MSNPIDLEQLSENLERAEGLLDMLADIGSDAELEVVNAIIAAARLVADGEVIRREDIDYEAALNEYLYLRWAAQGYGPYAEELADRVLDNGVTVPVISNFEEARRIVDAALHLEGTE